MTDPHAFAGRQDTPDLTPCTFTWNDRDGLHRCDDFREHVEHHCCCGNTMHPATPPKRKKGRRR